MKVFNCLCIEYDYDKKYEIFSCPQSVRTTVANVRGAPTTAAPTATPAAVWIVTCARMMELANVGAYQSARKMIDMLR